MQVVVTIDHRFYRTPCGAVWTESAFPYNFWTRYLSVFDSVRVVGRTREVDCPSEHWVRADGPNVEFWSIPYYVGPFQYARRCLAIKASVQASFAAGSAVILRAASQISTCLVPVLEESNYPFGMEVVCDPRDVFAPEAVSGPLRIFFRWWFCKHLRKQCSLASGVAYVTQQTLQRRYPPRHYNLAVSDVLLSPTAAPVSTSYSSVALPGSAYSGSDRRIRKEPNHWTLVSVATMTQRYKGQDTLLRAARICMEKGHALRVILVGEGVYRRQFEELAQKLGIADSVTFTGALPIGDKVFEVMDSADVFVHPSHADGLPRAIIEAMARGLPCIASNVGGIPELVGPDELIPPNDPVALADAILALLNDPLRMARISDENSRKAHEYSDEVLAPRRKEFYEHVRSVTSEHLLQQA